MLRVFAPLLCSGVILGMGSANERRRYIVTSSLIGWADTQNDPWCWICWVTWISMRLVYWRGSPWLFYWRVPFLLTLLNWRVSGAFSNLYMKHVDQLNPIIEHFREYCISLNVGFMCAWTHYYNIIATCCCNYVYVFDEMPWNPFSLLNATWWRIRKTNSCVPCIFGIISWELNLMIGSGIHGLVHRVTDTCGGSSNSLRLDDTYMRQLIMSSLVQVMACSSACSMTNHYMNQYWIIFNLALMNKFRWN